MNLETIATQPEPLRITCAQIWGGILAVDMDVSTAGLSASIFSLTGRGSAAPASQLETASAVTPHSPARAVWVRPRRTIAALIAVVLSIA